MAIGDDSFSWGWQAYPQYRDEMERIKASLMKKGIDELTATKEAAKQMDEKYNRIKP